MNSRVCRHATVFLRHAAFLAGMLAVIAGIFGMHVLTGIDGMPAPAVVAATDVHPVQQLQAQQGPAAFNSQNVPADASPDPGTAPAPACAGSDPCTDMSTMHAVCVPSPASESLAAPLPGNTSLAAPGSAMAGTSAARYSYLPESPSPGELCVSRT